jgi:hypothetical protein
MSLKGWGGGKGEGELTQGTLCGQGHLIYSLVCVLYTFGKISWSQKKKDIGPIFIFPNCFFAKRANTKILIKSVLDN